MSASTEKPSDTPAPPLPAHLLEVCDAYKRAWRDAAHGRPVPRVEDFLPAAPPTDQPALRAELLLLDSWMRDLLPEWGVPASRLTDAPASVPSTIPRAPGAPVLDSREYDFSVTADHVPAADPAADATADATPDPAALAETKSADDRPSAPARRAAGRVPEVPGYEVLGELGKGGMGVVYKARQVKADRVVALKVMLNADRAPASARARFDKEARANARMQHENIVRVFEVGEADGAPYFTQELVAGGTLSDLGRKELLPPRRAAELVEAIARAVHYAHAQNIVHRDLKPANILLTPDGRPKVADFGLAKEIEDADDGLTRDGAVMGTPSYMSPEQAFGTKDKIGPASDTYALGAILYDLLAGRPPFKGSTTYETLEQVRHSEPVPPTQFRPGTPRDLETICLKCLQKEPERRYASAEAVADDLLRYLDNRPILARPISNAERLVRWARRNRAVAGLLTTAFVLLAALAAGGVFYSVQLNAKNKKISEEKERIAKGHDLYRGVIQEFTADVPELIDRSPLGAQTKEEFLRFLAEKLTEADQRTDDLGMTRRGVQATINAEGDLARARRDYDAARAKYEESRRVSEEQLRDPQGQTDRLRGNLAMAYLKIAGVERARTENQSDEAVTMYEQALAIQERVLTAPESGNVPAAEARVWVATTLVALAEYARLRKQLAPARGHAARALEVLAAGDPAGLPAGQKEQYGLVHAAAHLEAGRVAFLLGDEKAGHAGFLAAMALYDAAAKANPKSTRVRMLATVPAAEYGDRMLVRYNNPASAHRLYDRALAYLRPVVVTPELSWHLRRLALDFYRKAMAHMKGTAPNDPALARHYFERAWGLMEGAFHGVNEQFTLSTGAEREAITGEQNRIRAALMLYRARTGRFVGPAGALDIAENVRIRGPLVKPGTPQYVVTRDWYMTAAITFGLAAEAQPAGGLARKMLFAKAVHCLGASIARGYDNAEFVRTDPDLDCLRGDPRFAPTVAPLLAR